MNINVGNVLGSEYAESIEREIRKLKQSDQLLLGEVLAVIKRSDRNIGRPIEDCNTNNENTYVVFAPTKYSIVCHKDVNTIRNEGSDFIFISVNSFVEQLLEFNFTYLQILFGNQPIYLSDKFISIVNNIKDIIKQNENIVFHKAVCTIQGISKDIHKDKFKDNVIRDRVFFLYSIYIILIDYLSTGYFDFKTEINIYVYNDLIKKYTKDKFEHFAKKLNELYDIDNKQIDIEKLKKDKDLNKLENKYILLKDLINTVLED